MLEETIRRALRNARNDGCGEDDATVFAVCAVLAVQPDLGLRKILQAIEQVRRHRPARAL